MNFRSQGLRPRRPDDRLDITPLIDVVFLLLVFFLVTSNYVRERRSSIPVEVPTASTGEPQSELRTTLVEIDREGDLFLDQQRVPDLDQLEAALKGVHERAPETLVLVRCDERAPFGLSVRVIDLARAVGLSRFGIVTKEPN